ncbi:hypothetical protein ACFYN0_26310 [Streptomyces sp. NPDC006704]|uniref:hypothetical protein n=1 Tax=Streptomyces sp. NPDC006704 TaxID=3364760 RepID=UPI0036A3AE73
MSDDYAPRTADDVTEELVGTAASTVLSNFPDFPDGPPVDWEDVFDRVDGRTLDDGRTIDLGSDLNSPALKALKRRVRARIKEQ